MAKPVIIVPGLPGSKLRRMSDGVLVWIAIDAATGIALTSRTFVRDLSLSADHPDTLESVGILDEVAVPFFFDPKQYIRLITFLARDRRLNVVPFFYDWRKSIASAAQELANTIDAQSSAEKCTVIAHSTGGLVVRHLIDALGGETSIERLILLGAPNRGTLKTLYLMQTGDAFAALFSPVLPTHDVMAVTATWQSSYELLPTDPNQGLFVNEAGVHDSVFGNTSWLPAQHRDALAAAATLVKALKSTIDIPTVVVYGDGLSTLSQARWNGSSMDFHRALTGDGTIPSVSAAALWGDRVKYRPVPFAVHSELYAHNVVQQIISDEINEISSGPYIQVAIRDRLGLAGSKNHLIVELRDNAGQPFAQTDVAVQLQDNHGFVGTRRAVPPVWSAFRSV